MRVLHVAATPFFSDRGCHVRIYEEVKRLARLGVEQVICTYHIGRDMPGLDIRRCIRVPWYKRTDARPSIHKVYIDFLVLVRAIRVARRFRPQVIHGHTHEGAFFGSLLGRYLRLPVVFDAQDESMAKALTDTYRVASRRRLLGRTAAWVDRWVVRKCDAIVASSTRIARSFIEGHGVAPEKVVVALDGVDTEMFHPRFADPNLKSELGLPRDCVLIAFVGLLEPHQGIDVMLEAFGHVAQQFPKAHLLVMGYPRVEEYRSKAEKPGLSGRVVFTGRMDYLRLPRFLASADIGIAPKLDRNESNGKVYNYMASGLPVVAFDTDVNREILDVLGDYAEYGSAEDLADAILTVCERDRERRVKKGRALRRRAEERFTWTRSAQRILDVYQWLVASGHRTAAEPRPPQADK